MKYSRSKETERSALVSISNHRYRNVKPYARNEKDKNFASVHDICVNNIYVYCDDKVIEKTVLITIRNVFESAKYEHITIKDVFLNGKKLVAEEMQVALEGVDKSALIIE